MSDYTPLTVVVYAFNPRRRAKLVSVLNTHGVGLEDSFAYDPDATDEGLDGAGPWRFGAGEARCGTVETLVHELRAADPGIAVRAWEDPRYEWLGLLVMAAPRIGIYTAECDAGGNPVFTATAVAELVKLPARRRDRALGVPWDRLFEKLDTAPSDSAA